MQEKLSQTITSVNVRARELGRSARRRLADETGQTAAEYMGILVLVGIVMFAIFQLGIHTTIADAIGDVIDSIAGGEGREAGGGGEGEGEPAP